MKSSINIAALGIKHVELDFFTKTRDDFYNQHELSDEFLILTHSSTDKKKRQLDIPRFALNDKLKIGVGVKDRGGVEATSCTAD